MIDLGQPYQATLAVTDGSGAPASPATAVLTITLPDGTTVTPPVTLPPVEAGLLTVDYPTVQAGLHKAAWSTTGPVTASVDYFSVRQFISIISLAEARDHLNITRTTNDAELRRFMMAATEVAESKAGTCVVRQVTGEFIPGSRLRVIRLPSAPVSDVSSVSIGSARKEGPAWTADQLIVNPVSGTCQPGCHREFWGGPWVAAYTAGRPVIPEHLEHAAKEQLRHLWETQRGAQRPGPLQGEETFTTTAGWTFSVPRRVLELLEPDVIPVVGA